IQSVIDSSGAGDTISFTPGAYDVSTTLHLKSNLVLAGQPGAELVSTAPVTMVDAQHVSHVTIEGLTFDGGSGGAGPVSGSNAAVFLNGDTGVNVVNNTFQHLTADAAVFVFDSDTIAINHNTATDIVQFASIHPNNAPHQGLEILDNNISNVSRFGIEIQGPEDHFYVDGNTLSGIAGIAISVVDDSQQERSAAIANNFITSAGVGIEMGDANMNVIGNTMTNMEWGISVSATPNSFVELNNFASVTHPFSPDGGFTGQETVGVNTIDNHAVNGWFFGG
ncbi:MAG TPA: right-handed parallel beta-helix repeat-containing protein, partial [Stellaceae bacterium]|nr:right-handed parallel beta-helix repeat-containing protein [Stellaceae bacterium]